MARRAVIPFPPCCPSFPFPSLPSLLLSLALMDVAQQLGSLLAPGGSPDVQRLLVEIERGLKLKRSADVAQVVVLAGRALRTTPLPSFVNAVLLRLADLFASSNNFLRFVCLSVLLDVQDAVQTAVNFDEMATRLAVCLYSNDPTARAMTLRAVGALGPRLASRIDLQHAVRNALDTTDRVEKLAALAAMDAMCVTCPGLAEKVLPKFDELLRDVRTEPDVRLTLVRVLRNMYHDADTAEPARRLALDLLLLYPTSDVTMAVLGSLTSLAVRSRFDVDAQVATLLEFVRGDARHRVRRVALRNLAAMAAAVPPCHAYIDLDLLVRLLADAEEDAGTRRDAARVLACIGSASLERVDGARLALVLGEPAVDLSVAVTVAGVLSCMPDASARIGHSIWRLVRQVLVRGGDARDALARDLCAVVTRLAASGSAPKMAEMAWRVTVALVARPQPLDATGKVLALRLMAAVLRSAAHRLEEPPAAQLKQLVDAAASGSPEVARAVVLAILELCEGSASGDATAALESLVAGAPPQLAPWTWYKIAERLMRHGRMQLARTVLALGRLPDGELTAAQLAAAEQHLLRRPMYVQFIHSHSCIHSICR